MYKTFSLIILLSSALFSGNTYYANNQNSCSGDGSFTNPFQSVSNGISALQAGDTLYIRGSQAQPAQQYNESLSISDSYPSGTEYEPIVVLNYNDELVRIVLSGSFSIYANWWSFSGLHFDVNQNTSDGIKPRGDHLTFRNFEISNGQRDGFDINNASYLLIESCKIYNFNRSDKYDAHGIILNGGTGNTLRGNTIYDCKGDCIQLYNSEQNYKTVIEDNDLYTTLGGGSENAIDIKATQGCIIRNNKMHGFHDSDDSDGVALKINKNSDKILVEENDIYESNGGMRITGGDVDSITIRYNVIHDLHVDGGDTSKYGYGIQFEGVNDVAILSNTFANIPGPLFWIEGSAATNMNMRNNLFYNSNVFKGSASDFNGTVSIDYNGWFQCREIITGANNIVGEDPKFKDAPARNYQLADDSPAIDKGDPASGVDFPGGRIDLGAFEYEEATSIFLPNGNGKGPTNFILEQNHPNPFNPSTVISYQFPVPSFVNVVIYNSLGQKVQTLVNRKQQDGIHSVTFNAGNLSSGVYFYALSVNGLSRIRKMTLLQ